MHTHWNKTRATRCPCHGCSNFLICQKNKLVCEEFRYYATGIKIHVVAEHIPSREEYDLMLVEEKRDESNSL